MTLPKAGRFYQEICKRLGITESGLRVLFCLKRGDDISGGVAGAKLEQQGFVTERGYSRTLKLAKRFGAHGGLRNPASRSASVLGSLVIKMQNDPLYLRYPGALGLSWPSVPSMCQKISAR
jgi:hypothetical protein